MWPQRAHLLSSLTRLTGEEGILKWTADIQQAFKRMKAVFALDCMLRYPDHNHLFTSILMQATIKWVR